MSLLISQRLDFFKGREWPVVSSSILRSNQVSNICKSPVSKTSHSISVFDSTRCCHTHRIALESRAFFLWTVSVHSATQHDVVGTVGRLQNHVSVGLKEDQKSEMRNELIKSHIFPYLAPMWTRLCEPYSDKIFPRLTN